MYRCMFKSEKKYVFYRSRNNYFLSTLSFSPPTCYRVDCVSGVSCGGLIATRSTPRHYNYKHYISSYRISFYEYRDFLHVISHPTTFNSHAVTINAEHVI